MKYNLTLFPRGVANHCQPGHNLRIGRQAAGPTRAFSARHSLFLPHLDAPTNLVCQACVSGRGVRCAAHASDDRPLEARFEQVVRPFLKDNCFSCHGPEKPKGKLDLSGYTSVASVVKDHKVWGLVRERVEAEEMPPAEARRQPKAEDRRAFVGWIEAPARSRGQAECGRPWASAGATALQCRV